MYCRVSAKRNGVLWKHSSETFPSAGHSRHEYPPACAHTVVHSVRSCGRGRACEGGAKVRSYGLSSCGLSSCGLSSYGLRVSCGGVLSSAAWLGCTAMVSCDREGNLLDRARLPLDPSTALREQQAIDTLQLWCHHPAVRERDLVPSAHAAARSLNGRGAGGSPWHRF